jgi:dihydropteroate synthase
MKDEGASSSFSRHPSSLVRRSLYTVPLPRRGTLHLGERTLVMGIINVTPDSFADGGLRFDPERAVADGLQMVADGADILDVGGESTRPGAQPLPEDEEMRRVLPVVEHLSRQVPVPLSIDTYKGSVAREAVARGAAIVNDVSALQYDERLVEVVAETGAALVVMHNRGRSRDMYGQASYSDVAAEIAGELQAAIDRAESAGVRRDAIIVDPGLGFAKRPEHTYEAIASLGTLRSLDRPLLSGPSRKSFLTHVLGSRPAREREWGTAAAVAASVLLGAHIVRVHGVREMVDVVRVADRIAGAVR